uniref:solute carrier family 22 member 8-like isoform X2 n=1 Tax=Ciona intestinalis TaxID=7719 RepID=UPI000EF4D2D0|nr:solute carrier family 22 member 8-like isoform X2 [Ciona intestinalis]|eukprot:XP_026692776.1 solute carrier family 22 member 8-like isoform X2 [Ciona intestinalis]
MDDEQRSSTCGTYYKLAISLLCLTAVIGVSPLYENVFLTYVPGYHCLQNTDENATDTSLDLDAIEPIPRQCYLHNDSSYNSSDLEDNNATRCESWRFLKPSAVESISTEFSLVCGDAWLSPMLISIQMFGFMVGSIAGGTLSDRFGRRPVYLSAIFLEASSLLAMSLSPILATMYVFMFLTGAGMIVRGMTGIVIVNEIVPNSYRRAVGILAIVSESLSGTLVAPMAMLLPNWRWMIMSTGVSLFVVSVPVFIFIYETLKWLHQTGNHGEVEKVQAKIRRINGEKLCEENHQDSLEERNQLTTEDTDKKRKSYNYLDLFKVGFIRRRTFILSSLSTWRFTA